MADNPITVPLPQDLPQNWTYGQTIGPQGTDVGLTQQHGYNYLMKQVNAAQQAAKELGEAFEALNSESIGAYPKTGGNVDGIVQIKGTGRIDSNQYGTYIYGEDNGKQQWILFLNNVNDPTIQNDLEHALILAFSETGAEWSQQYTVIHSGLIQQSGYSVPLGNGWEAINQSEYAKTLSGIVVLTMALQAKTSQSMYDVIATMPSGFRPKSTIEFGAVRKAGSVSSVGTLALNTDGTIQLLFESGVNENDYIFANVSYLSGG